MTWTKGQLLQSGKYRITQELGSGGFGLTYLAEDPSLRRQVVIKTPNRIFQRDQEYERFVRRFKNEGQALARISHPNVVRVVEYFEEQGMPCLVMEYVQGETLNQLIRRRGKLSEDQAVRCFRDLATALQFVHQTGLIHCDVHPGNIMLRQAESPVLIDFGSAKTLQPSTQTVTTTTNDFAPYEQGQPNSTPQPTLDIYGLASTLYFAVTGSKPQSAMSRKLYGDSLKEPKQHCADLSDWLNQAILKGMTLEAQDRPLSMQEWLNLLQLPRMPQPTPVSRSKEPEPRQPTQTVYKPEPKRPAQTVQPSFSWVALGCFALGYLPSGILLGWSSSLVWIVIVVVAVVVAVAVAMTWAGAWIGVWSLAVAVAVAWAMTGAGTWAVAWAWAWIGAWVGTVAADEVNWLGSLTGALLGGAISGSFTGLGIWSGLGIGLLAFVQFLLLGSSLLSLVHFLGNCNRISRLFIIGIPTALGLALGSGLGWWLKLSGVKFPF